MTEMSKDRSQGGTSQGTPRRMSRRRFVGLAALMALSAGGLGLLLVEGALRAFVPVTDISTTFYDPVTGPRMAPNQSGRWIIGDYVNSPFHFNAQGWNHTDDYVIRKPPGTVRVCMVGDSQVESLQVRCEEAMYSVAERRMAAAGKPAQWYAFGNSGWGTAQHTQVIQHYVLDYQPDVVILLFVQNDPFDCSPYLVKLSPYSPWYWLDESEALAYRPPAFWQASKLGRLALMSAAYRYFFPQKHVFQRHTQTRSVGGLPLMEGITDAKDEQVPGLAKLTLRERQAMTWKLIAALLAKNRDECARRGARFAVAFRGWSDEIEQPLGSKFGPVPPKEEDPFCLDGPRFSEMGREQVGPICERLGIPYLDLTEGLMAAPKGGRSSRFPDDNHLSAAGHEAAGVALAGFVESILASPGLPQDR